MLHSHTNLFHSCIRYIQEDTNTSRYRHGHGEGRFHHSHRDCFHIHPRLRDDKAMHRYKIFVKVMYE